MPRVTLYVPDDLKARMDDAAEAVNWSAVAQRAFREAIFTHFVRKDHSDMEKVIERLRASKERFETRQFAAGKEAGSKWAKTDAEYDELAAVAALDAEAHEHSDIGPDDLQQVIDPDGETLPHEWAEFWENHYGRGTPSGAFIRGFMKGATEIHDEIADQL